MATRAKYTRAKPNEENNEAKLDTDILMRFSPTYGKIWSSQASMCPEHSPSFSENRKASLLLKLLRSLWIKLFGLHKLSEEKLRDCTWLSTFLKEKLLIFGSLDKKVLSLLDKKDS